MRYLRFKSSLSYIVFPWRSRNKTQNVTRDAAPVLPHTFSHCDPIIRDTEEKYYYTYNYIIRYCENLNRTYSFSIVGNARQKLMLILYYGT